MDSIDLEALLASGDFTAAETACQRRLAITPDDAHLWEFRGRVALAAGDLRNAEACFGRAMELAPTDPMSVFGMARLHHRQGGLGKAGKFAARALALGLGGEAAEAASVLAAYRKIALGKKEAAMRRLAGQAPRFSRMPSEAFAETAVARDAMSCAACAGDVALAERVFAVAMPAGGRIAPLAISATASLSDWCARQGVALSVIEAARDVVIPASTSYSRSFTYCTEPVLLTALSGAEWVPGWDFVIAPDGTVLDGSGYMRLTSSLRTSPHFYLEGLDRAIYPTSSYREDIDADVLFLSVPTLPNFGHWTIDFLPRLRALDVLGGADLKIAVPEDLGAKHIETLAMWGITEERLVRCRRDRRYRFRTLHLLVPGRAMPPNPTHVAFVRARLYASANGGLRRTGPKRIFLARTSVGTRQVANTAEFEALLAREGFVSLEMADLSIAEQCEQLSGAEILLGAFGTNLLALYFAPSDCTVIALMDKIELDPTIAPTASLLGMRHQFLVCPPAPERGHSLHAKDTDIVVDCVELKRRLDEIARGL